MSSFDPSFNMPEELYGAFGLECQPLLDDCLWHYKNPDESIKGVITTHVDDLAITCHQTFLDEQFKLMTEAFGKIS